MVMASRQPLLWVLIALLLLSISCTLIAEGTLTDDQRLVREERPALILLAPETNRQYAPNTEVILHALATDSVGVSRVDFLIDAPGLEEMLTVTVPDPQPDTPVNAIVRWQAPVQELYIVEVRAFRAAGDPNDPNDDIPSNVAIRTFEVVPRPVNNVPQPTETAIPPRSNPELDITPGRVNNASAVPIRQGPGPAYTILEDAAPGVILNIVGRSVDNIWLVVELPTGFGWIIAETVTLPAAIETLPPVEAPPLPE
jgi:hypothetical protein